MCEVVVEHTVEKVLGVDQHRGLADDFCPSSAGSFGQCWGGVQQRQCPDAGVFEHFQAFLLVELPESDNVDEFLRAELGGSAGGIHGAATQSRQSLQTQSHVCHGAGIMSQLIADNKKGKERKSDCQFFHKNVYPSFTVSLLLSFPV